MPRPIPKTEFSAAEVAALNKQIDAILVLVRKAGTRGPYSARCAQAQANLLEKFRAEALAEIAASVRDAA